MVLRVVNFHLTIEQLVVICDLSEILTCAWQSSQVIFRRSDARYKVSTSGGKNRQLSG